jgi:hypothetical protein
MKHFGRHNQHTFGGFVSHGVRSREVSSRPRVRGAARPALRG